MLILDKEFCERVVCHDAVVVCRSERLEKAMGDGEERHMLDIGVVLRRVCDDVVDIVAAFPPS